MASINSFHFIILLHASLIKLRLSVWGGGEGATCLLGNICQGSDTDRESHGEFILSREKGNSSYSRQEVQISGDIRKMNQIALHIGTEIQS